MAIQFMKGQFKVQKYAVNEYLNLFDMIFGYTIDHYELPEYTQEEKQKVSRSIEREWHKNYAKEIFSNEQVAKRFVKELEENFANNGSDSFAYTCRTAAESGVFFYTEETKLNELSKKSSKLYKDMNANMIRIFNPLLDKWANEMALLFEKHLVDIRAVEQKDELALLESLAKKHGKTLK